jgi:hypothetical protein
MRLASAAAALCFAIPTSNAAVGDRYKCHPGEFQNLTAYGPREASRLRKNYEIIIGERSIQVVFEENDQKVTHDYNMVGETVGEMFGVKADGGSLDGISVAKYTSPKYEGRRLISVTTQGGDVVRIWMLLCYKGD